MGSVSRISILCCTIFTSFYAQNVANEALFQLPMRKGIKVGYTREISLGPGMTRTMKTINMNPTIFEIPNFVSPEECEKMIKMAKQVGLRESQLHSEPLTNYSEKETKATFDRWDKNSNGVLELMEFANIDGQSTMFLGEKEILEMINSLNADLNKDNAIDYEEFKTAGVGRIRDFFNDMRQNNPLAHGRNSSQAWIWHYGAYNDLLEAFNGKIAKLTMLPQVVIEMSEPIQVVNYGVTGHYHCHHDSDRNDARVPCCTYKTQSWGTCRLCRFVTVLYFLNNVRDGGETAFPVAGNETFTNEDWQADMKDKCNLVKNCHKSNLILKPKQGTAIMWYNHHLDEKTGWVGRLNMNTYHGGCGVVKGQKWIANNWINVIGRPGSSEVMKGWLRSSIVTARDHDEL